jgi:hypothetical protein
MHNLYITDELQRLRTLYKLLHCFVKSPRSIKMQNQPGTEPVFLGLVLEITGLIEPEVVL